jgi:hypothetical protein
MERGPKSYPAVPRREKEEFRTHKKVWTKQFIVGILYKYEDIETRKRGKGAKWLYHVFFPR